ncbi:hypothetical protein ACFXTH_044453 [Malus domestica]
MPIPAPYLQGTTTATPAILKFPTASLELVLHRARLGEHVQYVTKSVSSLRVCQDKLQILPTKGEDGMESQFEGLDLTLGLNHSRAIEAAPFFLSSTVVSPRLSLYFPPLTFILHLESVTKAHCSFSADLIPSISPEIGSSPTVPMDSLQTAPHLPSWIPSLAPLLLSTSQLLTAMMTSSRTRASTTVDGSRTTNRSGHTTKQIKRFMKTIATVKMNRTPT